MGLADAVALDALGWGTTGERKAREAESAELTRLRAERDRMLVELEDAKARAELVRIGNEARLRQEQEDRERLALDVAAMRALGVVAWCRPNGDQIQIREVAP